MFSRSRILRRRTKLFRALAAYINVEISGAVIQNMADDILKEMPATVVRAAVYDSVRAAAGTVLTRPKAARFAWRLAGNIERLEAGGAVLPWSGHVVNEIVPVCVERVVPFVQGKRSGYIFHCRAQAGSMCAEVFTQFFASNSLRAIARVVGFSTNSRGPLQYGGVARHFVNLLFFAHMDAALSRNGPAFHNVSISSGMLQKNKELLRVRCQAEPCPQGYTHACANCFRGYDTCLYAVRDKTFSEAHCRLCNQSSFFDPSGDGLACINCSRQQRSLLTSQED